MSLADLERDLERSDQPEGAAMASRPCASALDTFEIPLAKYDGDEGKWVPGTTNSYGKIICMLADNLVLVNKVSCFSGLIALC